MFGPDAADGGGGQKQIFISFLSELIKVTERLRLNWKIMKVNEHRGHFIATRTAG